MVRTRNVSKQLAAVCRNRTWFSKLDDTVYANVDFDSESMCVNRLICHRQQRRWWGFSGAASLDIMQLVTTTPSPREQAAQHADTLPAEVSGRMDTVLHDLEAAGFQTRSVTA